MRLALGDYELARPLVQAPARTRALAGVEGLEPPALGFGDRCSTS